MGVTERGHRCIAPDIGWVVNLMWVCPSPLCPRVVDCDDCVMDARDEKAEWSQLGADLGFDVRFDRSGAWYLEGWLSGVEYEIVWRPQRSFSGGSEPMSAWFRAWSEPARRWKKFQVTMDPSDDRHPGGGDAAFDERFRISGRRGEQAADGFLTPERRSTLLQLPEFDPSGESTSPRERRWTFGLTVGRKKVTLFASLRRVGPVSAEMREALARFMQVSESLWASSGTGAPSVPLRSQDRAPRRGSFAVRLVVLAAPIVALAWGIWQERHKAAGPGDWLISGVVLAGMIVIACGVIIYRKVSSQPDLSVRGSAFFVWFMFLLGLGMVFTGFKGMQIGDRHIASICDGESASWPADYTTSDPPHPVVAADMDKREVVDVGLGAAWQPSLEPSEAQLVLCMTPTDEQFVQRCSYQADRTADLFDVTYEVTLREARTAEVVATDQLTTLNRTCPTVLFLSDEEARMDSPPIYTTKLAGVGSFLKPYVFGDNIEPPSSASDASKGNPPQEGVCVPELISPREGEVLDNGRTDRTDAVEWTFEWSECPDADSYQLEVAAQDAAIPAIAEILSATRYDYRSEGSYIGERTRFGWTWQVRARTGGVWSDWAERSFDVEPADTD